VTPGTQSYSPPFPWSARTFWFELNRLLQPGTRHRSRGHSQPIHLARSVKCAAHHARISETWTTISCCVVRTGLTTLRGTFASRTTYSRLVPLSMGLQRASDLFSTYVMVFNLSIASLKLRAFCVRVADSSFPPRILRSYRFTVWVGYRSTFPSSQKECSRACVGALC